MLLHYDFRDFIYGLGVQLGALQRSVLLVELYTAWYHLHLVAQYSRVMPYD